MASDKHVSVWIECVYQHLRDHGSCRCSHDKSSSRSQQPQCTRPKRIYGVIYSCLVAVARSPCPVRCPGNDSFDLGNKNDPSTQTASVEDFGTGVALSWPRFPTRRYVPDA